MKRHAGSRSADGRGDAVGAVRAYQAPQQPGAMVIEVEKLKDNLFMLKGGGGNTAVFIGANGVTVVDAKNPGWGAADPREDQGADQQAGHDC